VGCCAIDVRLVLCVFYVCNYRLFSAIHLSKERLVLLIEIQRTDAYSTMSLHVGGISDSNVNRSAAVETCIACMSFMTSINVKNFHGSLTAVVKAQNDTSKTANITGSIFARTYWYCSYKRRRSSSSCSSSSSGSSRTGFCSKTGTKVVIKTHKTGTRRKPRTSPF